MSPISASTYVAVVRRREEGHILCPQNKGCFDAVIHASEEEHPEGNRTADGEDLRPGPFGTEEFAQAFAQGTGPAGAKPAVTALQIRQAGRGQVGGDTQQA